MTATAASEIQAINLLDSEPGLPGSSKRPARCAWCGQDWRSIVELIDHVEAAHLDRTDMASPASATRSPEEV